MIKKLLYSLLLLICVFSVASCKKGEKELKEDVSIHTELQEKFLLADNYALATVYAKGKEELSRPMPVTLTWKDASTNVYTITLSESENFETTIDYSSNTNSIDIYNLKIDTTYYWKVSTEEEIKSFHISDLCPRNLYIDGITNCRDLGGWKIDDTHSVKQGLIFRTSKLNNDASSDVLISSAGIKTMLEELKVKSEIDLRRTDNNESGCLEYSVLGDSIIYYACPMRSDGNILYLNDEMIVKVFEILGNEDNYPIFFHCSIGTDRTGLIAFLINGLLGVSNDGLYRDYLFSNYGNIGGMRTPSAIDTYTSNLAFSDGETTKEKIYNYLLEIGVSKENLDNVIRILTEEKRLN